MSQQDTNKNIVSIRIVERSGESCADRSTSMIMNDIERIFSSMNEFIKGEGLKRNKYYVGVIFDGKPRTFMKFRPYRSFFHIETKGKYNQVLLGRLHEEGIDVKWIDQRGKEKYYRITLRNYDDYRQHKKSIDGLTKQAMTYFGFSY